MKTELRRDAQVGSISPAVREDFWQVFRFIPIVLLLVILALLSGFVPYFLSVNNFVSILVQSSALGLMAIGLTAVLITGGMDLSIPSLMSFTAVLGALHMRAGGGTLRSPACS
jgi:ribose/xylose/arabinose/galactoside ABC-type transport system permease subunit